MVLSAIWAFQADHTNISGNVRIVWVVVWLPKWHYISGQNGTAVHHYVRKCKKSLGLIIISISLHFRTGWYCWCSTTTCVRSLKEKTSCLLQVQGLPAAAGKRQGSDAQRRSYCWWYCSLVLVLLWSVVTRAHTQPSSGKMGIRRGTQQATPPAVTFYTLTETATNKRN